MRVNVRERKKKSYAWMDERVREEIEKKII